jgi:hypothetical protein
LVEDTGAFRGGGAIGGTEAADVTGTGNGFAERITLTGTGAGVGGAVTALTGGGTGGVVTGFIGAGTGLGDSLTLAGLAGAGASPQRFSKLTNPADVMLTVGFLPPVNKSIPE